MAKTIWLNARHRFKKSPRLTHQKTKNNFAYHCHLSIFSGTISQVKLARYFWWYCISFYVESEKKKSYPKGWGGFLFSLVKVYPTFSFRTTPIAKACVKKVYFLSCILSKLSFSWVLVNLFHCAPVARSVKWILKCLLGGPWTPGRCL